MTITWKSGACYTHGVSPRVARGGLASDADGLARIRTDAGQFFTHNPALDLPEVEERGSRQALQG